VQYLTAMRFLLLFLTLFSIPLAPAQQGPAKEHFGKPQSFWLQRLQSNDLLERDEAIQVFARVGTDGRAAAPLLKLLLKDPALPSRLQVALALWKIQADGTDAAPTLARDFPLLTPAQKGQVVSFILGLKKADEPSFALLEVFHNDPQFATHVRFHLPALGPEAVPLYGKWIERSKGKDRVDLVAGTPLAYLIASRGAIVTPYLHDADPVCQAASAAVLLAVPGKRQAAVDALISLAESKDKEASNRALWALCHHPQVSPKAAPVYFQALKHSSLEHRLAAVRPVLTIAPDRAEEVLPVLEEGLKATSFLLRNQSYLLVPELKDKGEKLAPVLVAKLKEPALGGETYSVLGALAPQAGRVGKEVGEILFADPKTANRFLSPALRPFVPHFLDVVVKHLEGEDATRKHLAVSVARWAPLAVADKLLPRLRPLLKDETLAEAVLAALETQGKGARAAVPEVAALLEGKPMPNRVAAIQRTLLRLEPEPTALGGLLDQLKGKAELAPEQRVLAAELALLHPERRKEATDFVEPLLEAKDTFRSYALQRLLEKLGPDAVGLVPRLHARLKQDPSALLQFDRVLTLLGPAAREVVPTLLAQASKELSYSELLRKARVVAAIDPEQRRPVEERLSRLFVERLEKYPAGDELRYDFLQLTALVKEPPGPSTALVPLLRKVFRDHPREELQADLAVPLAQLDADFAPEVLRTLEDSLGAFPSCSDVALVGLLRLDPKHPRALAELKKYLEDANAPYHPFAARVALRCDRGLPGIRERLEAILKTATDNDLKFPIYLTLMRYDGKLNPTWVDEMLQAAVHDHTALRDLPALGAVGKPLIPRLRALPVGESRLHSHEEIIYQIERAR
jgi:hypothetical protein